jgi:hypothetical protein
MSKENVELVRSLLAPFAGVDVADDTLEEAREAASRSTRR